MAHRGRLGRADIKRIFRLGRRLSSDFFQITSLSSGGDGVRLAVIAGKSVDKRAAARNRLRRRLREYVRTHETLLPPGRDIAITLTKQAAALGRRDFYKALHEILIRIP